MQTILYRNRICRDRLVEAVLFTRDNDASCSSGPPVSSSTSPAAPSTG